MSSGPFDGLLAAEPMLNPMSLRGRLVLVTGASSGIGREVSVLLSQLDGRLVLVGRDAKRLAETHSQLHGTGHCVEPFDLNAIDEIPAWLRAVSSRLGSFDGLVHAAGILQSLQPLRALRKDGLEDVMRINTHAAVALARGLRQKGVYRAGASVVWVSSISGLVGTKATAAYAASKGALIAAARALAIELAGQTIRLNCVAPGLVRTAMAESMTGQLTEVQAAAIVEKYPLGLGMALDVAHAIAFLLADTGRWITGTTLVVDGGYTAQ